MNRRFRVHRVYECDIIGTPSNVWKQLPNLLSTLPVFLELPLRTSYAAFILMTAAAKSFDRNRFAVERIELRLVIKSIDVGRTAVHEQKDNRFRFRFVM